MKDFLIQLLNSIGLAYWIEIVTTTPRCTYYFGPFSSKGDAEVAQAGYLEDLSNEDAQGIFVEIKRCKPQNLTIFDETGEEFRPFKVMMPISLQ
ncbi:MAG: DUF1816 domain-containing protein [Woronichinia naegeliana WA131]|jgi:hypothetical protein|uniref:DUF1816 domain-containing protein n=1 Tax=Woronichinia naegeliana WA131 TaxID=2824559 RepID=A0A977KRS6_9CYAN|nr:MAG: DUF1816 domain-containing protein [Woronichinia naegeliana WA131]